MTMMMFRKPSNIAPCARKWSLAPTTPSETRSSVKRTTWWVSHICFLFFDHHDNMVSFSYMFLCSMILCDNHRHHDAPSRRTWRNVESVEPRSKARRFGQPEAFTMLNASNVKSASKTIIFKNKRRHLWKSICLFTISPPILVSPQTQSNLNPGAVYVTWHSQQMIRTGFIVHRLTNHHYLHHHHLHLHPPDHDQHSGLHEEVCGSLQCLQICNCPKRGTNEGVMMIMIVIMVIENMLAWKDKLPYNSIVMMTLFNDQYGNDDIAFFTQASRIHALDKDFHPHCFKCEVATTFISHQWNHQSELYPLKMITIRPRYLPSQIVSKRWNFIHSFFQWWKNVIVKMILKLRKIEEKTTRTARWFSTPGWRGKSVGRSGSTCSASNATDGGKTRVFLYFNFIVEKNFRQDESEPEESDAEEWTHHSRGVKQQVWDDIIAFHNYLFNKLDPNPDFEIPKSKSDFFYQKSKQKLAKMDKKVWTIWKQ